MHAITTDVVDVTAEPRVAVPDVAVLHWPEESVRAAALGRAGTPRLFLVASEAAPPADWDEYTDWVRLPADERDVFARITALRRRVAPPALPELDEFGVLWRDGVWVDLAPTEGRLMAALLDRVGGVVSRRDLAAAGWPDGAPNSRSVDSTLLRLRRRIGVLGMSIHTVRRRGLILEVDGV